MKTETAPKTVAVNLEYTDTFGGEANYAWVNRKTLEIPEGLSDRALVRRAKAEMGLTGIRCRTENFGDMFALYPAGCCTVLFISFNY